MPARADRSRAVQREVSARWTPALVRSGWTPIADFFLQAYSRLTPAITTIEAMFVIQLMTFKWDKEAPFPGFKSIAKRMGITTTSARNYARELEKKGYLKREKQVGTTNRFDLTPLFSALERQQAYEAGQRGEELPPVKASDDPGGDEEAVPF